jgi:hypothetical protein
LRQDGVQNDSRLAALQDENAQLRDEAAQLRVDVQALAQIKAEDAAAANDPSQKAMLSWLERLDKLKQSISQTPGAMIPEMQLLTEQDWLNAVRGKLETEEDYLRAFSALRNAAESKFTSKASPALQKYLRASGGKFPTDLSQLQAYFESPLDNAMLQRWEIVPASKHPNMGFGADWLITQKGAVDEERDARIFMGADGHGSDGAGFDPSRKTLQTVASAFAAANPGRRPASLAELLPYASTPDQQAALRKKIAMQDAGSK